MFFIIQFVEIHVCLFVGAPIHYHLIFNLEDYNQMFQLYCIYMWILNHNDFNMLLSPACLLCRGRCQVRSVCGRRAASWSMLPWQWLRWGLACLCTAPGRWRSNAWEITEGSVDAVWDSVNVREGLWWSRLKGGTRLCWKENVGLSKATDGIWSESLKCEFVQVFFNTNVSF